MELPKCDPPKLPDMVMCGDHPSFTKTELNMKDDKAEAEMTAEKLKETRISPSASLVERLCVERARVASEHALRAGGAGWAGGARRRGRSMELVARPDDTVPPNRALVQAALGSFRWPPYLVCVWVAVLLLTHLLHGLVAALERALPSLRTVCQHFRSWTEAAWRAGAGRRGAALAAAAGLLHLLYGGLLLLHAAALWALEPLYPDDDPAPGPAPAPGPGPAPAVYDVASRTSASLHKQ